MSSLKFFLLLSVFVSLVWAQRGQDKAGDCPPFPDVGVCEMTCFADNHCEGPFKCCRTACGGTFCMKPVTMRRVQNREKPGSCPDTPAGPWVCSSRCAIDSDCRGTRKCCKNRCGALACAKPQM